MGTRLEVVALVSAALLFTSVSACSFEQSAPTGSEIITATEAFFEASASFWDDNQDSGSFRDVEEMSIWHSRNEEQFERVLTAFRQWSELLDRSRPPELLVESRNRFADVMADFQEQVDMARNCIDDWPDSLDAVAGCFLFEMQPRMEDWERNIRSADEAWERWRTSGDE